MALTPLFLSPTHASKIIPLSIMSNPFAKDQNNINNNENSNEKNGNSVMDVDKNKEEENSWEEFPEEEDLSEEDYDAEDDDLKKYIDNEAKEEKAEEKEEYEVKKLCVYCGENRARKNKITRYCSGCAALLKRREIQRQVRKTKLQKVIEKNRKKRLQRKRENVLVETFKKCSPQQRIFIQNNITKLTPQQMIFLQKNIRTMKLDELLKGLTLMDKE